MAWNREKFRHGMAARRIKSKGYYDNEYTEADFQRELDQERKFLEQISDEEVELMENPEKLEKLIYELYGCDSQPPNDKDLNDIDCMDSICSLKIERVLDVTLYNPFPKNSVYVVEGTIAGIKNKYIIHYSYYHGNYYEPPSSELEWNILSEEIKDIEKKVKDKFDNINKLEKNEKIPKSRIYSDKQLYEKYKKYLNALKEINKR